jgi:hypothetical protein
MASSVRFLTLSFNDVFACAGNAMSRGARVTEWTLIHQITSLVVDLYQQ